jgi:hypothetical protein
VKRFLAQALADLQRTILFRQRSCFQTVFDLKGPHALEVERVLADLRDYCFVERSTFDPDPQMAAFRAGKREVALRIFYFLNLSDAEVHRLVEVKSDYVERNDDD